MVDSLNLNPARVKKILTKHGYKAYGRFPNRKNRNGREQVSYEQFYEELYQFLLRGKPADLYRQGEPEKNCMKPAFH